MQKNNTTTKLSAYLQYEDSHILGLIDEEGTVINWKDKERVERLKKDILEMKVENGIVDVRGHIRLIQPQYNTFILEEKEQIERAKKVKKKAVHNLLGESYIIYPEKFYKYSENKGVISCSLTQESREWIQSQQKPVVPMPLLHYKGEEVTSYRELFQDLKLKNSLDISNLNAHYVTDMSRMFAACKKYEVPQLFYGRNSDEEFKKSSFDLLGIEHLSTTRLENAAEMFKKTYIKTLDLEDFETCSLKYVREFWENASFGSVTGREIFKARIKALHILDGLTSDFSILSFQA